MQERQAAMQQVLTVREGWVQALETGKDVPPLPCGCASPEACSCGRGGSTAAQAAATLALAKCGQEASGAPPCCPLTGLSLSQIAELMRSPPEALQRVWKSIAQRLT